MRNTISAKLLHTLQAGKVQLGAEALRRVTCFVESQRTDEEAFMDKSGKADLYYTSFGWTLSYFLGIKMAPRKMDAYLAQQEPERLDMIHYAAYVRCRMLRWLATGGKAGWFLQSLLPVRIRAWSTMEGNVPHHDPQSPYSQFIRLSLLEDAGRWIVYKKGVAGGGERVRKSTTDMLAAYCMPGGGYRNAREGLAATTNATAAALAVKGQLSGYRENEDVLYLRNMQDASGGFRATAASPLPDLLSTATALFMLHCYEVKSKYVARDFIEAHWLDSGGFSATLLEEKSDVEYTFYGLLALGSA